MNNELKTLKDIDEYSFALQRSKSVQTYKKELKAEAVKWGKNELIEFPENDWEIGFNYGCFAILEKLNLDKELFQNIKEDDLK